nr:hypothetical protein [Tanacetum cinerariifolium]
EVFGCWCWQGSFAASFTVSLAVGSGPSVVDTGFVLVDDSSRISVRGDLIVYAAGNAGNGSVVSFKTTFKVKFGFPGLAFLPKWYWKMYLRPLACDSTVGTWYVSLSSMELTAELQSGTK